MQHKISVIIPNYNYGCFIGAAIDSVISQTYPAYEIIVVDDGSTDNSIEVVKSYGEKVKLIVQENRGAGAARNAGIKVASGDLIAFLDSDDIWFPDKLSKQVIVFELNKNAVMVSCGLREFDSDTNKTLAITNHGLSGWCADQILLIEPVVPGAGSTAVVKKEIIEKIGGFDERREMYSEDWEFCYRIAKVGKLAFLPETLVNYRNHGGNKHFRISRMEQAILLKYSEVFVDDSPELERFKNTCYANAHLMLSGSYFNQGNYRASISHGIKSLKYSPAKFWYIVNFFKRRYYRYYRKYS